MGALIHDCRVCRQEGDVRVEQADGGYRVRCRTCKAQGDVRANGYLAIRSWNFRERMRL